jgi:protein involved in polysaccharide export with SLBB domain
MTVIQEGLPLMKSKFMQLSQLFKPTIWKLSLLLPLLALGVAGCANPDYKAVMAPPNPDDTNALSAARLHIGDTVTISFDGLPDPILSQDKTINEDGTFTLSDIGQVKAAGKTTGELEATIHDLYVPKYYTHLTVTVKPGDRVFYVRGEVVRPDRQIYVGEITVTKAITSAGDFTDFANRRKVWLIRANGQRFRLNCDAILSGEAPDPPVYPGDQIEVTRRLY